MAKKELTLTMVTNYPELICAAIKAIDAINGANKTAISKHIETNSDKLPTKHSTLLSHHLNNMKDAGQLIMVRNNYVIPHADVPPRRGRGRPPKAKEPVLPVAASSSKRRGRPPKVRASPASTIAASVPIGGPKRGRGRPPKAGRSKAKATPLTSGERRGRGRPAKVKVEA